MLYTNFQYHQQAIFPHDLKIFQLLSFSFTIHDINKQHSYHLTYKHIVARLSLTRAIKTLTDPYLNKPEAPSTIKLD